MHKVALAQVCLQALQFPIKLTFYYKPNVFPFPNHPDAQPPIHWVSDFLSPDTKRSEREDDPLFHLVTRLRKTRTMTLKEKVKQSLDKSWEFQEFEAPRFQDRQRINVVRLLAVRIGHLYQPGYIPGTRFFWGLSRPQGHSAAGSILWMKSFNDTIGNRTGGLPACNIVPQPAVPPASYTSSLPKYSNVEDGDSFSLY
jgi:hypothetical protein